jgi:uncharacterized protein YeaO (DUF488 family)
MLNTDATLFDAFVKSYHAEMNNNESVSTCPTKIKHPQ